MTVIHREQKRKQLLNFATHGYFVEILLLCYGKKKTCTKFVT